MAGASIGDPKGLNSDHGDRLENGTGSIVPAFATRCVVGLADVVRANRACRPVRWDRTFERTGNRGQTG